MNRKNRYNLILLALLLTACKPESHKEQLLRQEQAIENYINRMISQGAIDSSRVMYNDGVYRLMLIEGTGEGASSGDSVIFHYWASVFNSNQYYDSTGQHPERAILGLGHYINGLEKGLSGMKINEYAEILLTGEQAYGNINMGILPPYTPVKFEILMLNVVKNN